jgi:hypothetical protein
MCRKFVLMLMGLLLMTAATAPLQASVDLEVQKTITLEAAPLDIKVSANGRWMFVLTDQSEILVYDADGKLADKIPVDKAVDGIQVGPAEEVLFLTSRSGRTVQVAALEFTRAINILGSPFKGAIDAPLVMVVFSDFQ